MKNLISLSFVAAIAMLSSSAQAVDINSLRASTKAMLVNTYCKDVDSIQNPFTDAKKAQEYPTDLAAVKAVCTPEFLASIDNLNCNSKMDDMIAIADKFGTAFTSAFDMQRVTVTNEAYNLLHEKVMDADLAEIEFRAGGWDAYVEGTACVPVPAYQK